MEVLQRRAKTARLHRFDDKKKRRKDTEILSSLAIFFYSSFLVVACPANSDNDAEVQACFPSSKAPIFNVSLLTADSFAERSAMFVTLNT